jgi:hypothetical protein
MKALGLKLANALAIQWHFLPQRMRLPLLKGLFVLESRGTDVGQGLARLFAVAGRAGTRCE